MNLQTNIIRNVYNIGTNSCDAGTQYCSDGYGLYFPCLKDITKGENVCMDFYITDNTTKDVVDLRTVDAISLDLNGQFGCSYGTFSYPDNINSLQTEKYDRIYTNEFGSRTLCTLNLEQVDINDESSEMYLNHKDNKFYSGTTVSISAFDTPTHIFIGWAKFDSTDDEECDTETWNDYIFSKNNTYEFVITKSETICALYRPRKKYSIIIDTDDELTHRYHIYYNGDDYLLTNRDDEIFEDRFGHFDNVLEGYHFTVECIPIFDYIFSDDGSDIEEELFTLNSPNSTLDGGFVLG